MDANTNTSVNMKQATKIFEEYNHTIRSAIRYHINNESNIDDIFQNFFLSLVKSPMPPHNQNIKAFINRAVRNDVIDAASQTRSYHLRNCKYAQIHKDRIRSKSPDDIVSHTEEIDRLFELAEKQLLKHEIEAIIQKYRYNRNADETARIMGISPRSVSHYLCTGLKKLRQCVHQEQLSRYKNPVKTG